MFTGLSAFPLTPFVDDGIDEGAYGTIVDRLVEAGVDSIGALGSTGSYAYLDRSERNSIARLSVQHAEGIPVIVGIGALSTPSVLELAEDAQEAGASAVLLSAMTYQQLTQEDVLGLFRDVTANLSVPLVVYDNPGTTHFSFTDELYASIAELPHVASIKIPGVPGQLDQVAERIGHLRQILPGHINIGVSGDVYGATGLIAGCDLWYSVIAGTMPRLAKGIVDAVRAGDHAAAIALSDKLSPLWELFARHGSLRVTAAIAEELKLARPSCLPRPIRGLGEDDRADVAAMLRAIDAL